MMRQIPCLTFLIRADFKLILAWTILFLSGCGSGAERYPVHLPVNGLHYEKSVKTWKDLKEAHIVMQQTDYSCGAAALATLMRYYFKDMISEKEISDDIFKRMTEQDVKNRKKEGLSLLDLKEFAERRGYSAWGGRLKLSALPKLHGPIIVYLNKKNEYQHFAVLRGVSEDRICLADPSRGNIRIPAEEFTEEWDGIVLVLGKPGFGVPSDYPLALEKNTPFRHEVQAARRGLY
jgi:predicted double-glycine peptidase